MFKKFHSTKLIRQAKKHQNQKQTNQTKTKSVWLQCKFMVDGGWFLQYAACIFTS